MPTTKPTVDEIRAKLATYKDRVYFGVRKTQVESDGFYEMTYKIGIDPPYRSFRSFISRRIVDTGAEHIASDNPVVLKDPLTQTKDAQERADKIEGFGNALLSMLMQADVHPVQETVKNFGVRGESFIKVYPNPDYPEKPERQKGERKDHFEARIEAWEDECKAIPPILWDILEPMTVYSSMKHRLNIPLDAIISYQRTVADVKNEYPKWKNPNHREDDENVDWLEYYSWEYRYFEADEEAVTDGVEENLLGVVPLVHLYSGLGKRNDKGTPDTLVRDLIFPVKDNIIAYSRAQSQLDSIVGLYTHPRIITSLSKKDLEGMELSPGAAITGIPENARFELNQGMSPHPALFQHVINLGNELEQYIPSPLGGGISGAESGYQQAQQISQGSLKYIRLKESTQHILEAALMLSFRFIKRVLRHDVVLRGITKDDRKPQIDTFKIKIKDLEDFTQVKVRLEPSDPEYRDRRALIGLRMRQQKEISRVAFLQDYASIPNASDEITQIYAEQILETNPMIQQVIGMKALEKMGMKEEAEMIQKQMQQQEQNAKSIQETSGMPSTDRSRRPGQQGLEMADLAIRQMQRGTPQQVGPLKSRVEEPVPL